MRHFGKCGGGGRRGASREKLPMPAVVGTIRENQLAVLVDLSATGARLRGSSLPGEGEVLSLKMDCVRAFGTVAWAEDGECGVEFDSPIFPFEVARLRGEVKVATLTCGSVEQMLAFEDWENGFAR